MVDNKQIMSKNIKRLMEEKRVNATEICETLGFKHNTFSDWVNGKSYPRIDKIEMMAKYFGVSKSELVEEPIHLYADDKSFDIKPTDAVNVEAIKLYYKYLATDKKTRLIINTLLDEDNA